VPLSRFRNPPLPAARRAHGFRHCLLDPNQRCDLLTPLVEHAGWRWLAGRLRRAQTFLRMLNIDIAFGREGRSGARMIRMSSLRHNNASSIAKDGEDWQNEGYHLNGESGPSGVAS
jgi:hypothetical protein